MKNKFSIALSLAVILSMLLTSLALADIIKNDVVASYGSTTVNYTAGGPAVQVEYFIDNNSAGGGGFSTCDAADGSSATVNINVPLGSGITASPSSLVFTQCGTATLNTQTVDFSTSADATPGLYTITVTVTDSRGNYNANDAKFFLNVSEPVPSDTTAPSGSVVFPDPVFGLNGWFNAQDTVPVVGTVSATDSSNVMAINCSGATLSDVTGLGTANASGTLTVSDEGVHNVNCTATDGASPANSGAASGSSNTATIKIDTIAPEVTAAADRPADHNGWYTSDVVISFTTPDAAACDEAVTYSGPDDSSASVSGTCTDDAGNVGTDAFDFKYDATGPLAALSVTGGAAGAHGWYTSDVTVHTSGSDDVSGPVTCTDDQFQMSETAGTVFQGSCTNDAGLTTNAAPLTVKLDKTGPSASLSATGTLGDNGWYTSNVTVSTSGSDTISSPVVCTGDQYLTADSTGAVFNGSCTNDAGFITNAAPLTIKRDATAPTLAPSVSPNPVVLNGSATALPNASDATSGVASSSCDAVDTSLIGSHTVNCTATDNAGNINSASASYSVIYNWAGFFQPVDNLPALNKAKAGSAIPVKFSLSGNQGLSIFFAGYPSSTQVACGNTANADLIETTVTAGGSSLSYDALADQYVYVWKTDKAWAGTCRTLTVKLIDGTTHQANFNFIR